MRGKNMHAIISFAVFLTIYIGSAQASTPNLKLFNTNEIQSSDISLFTKWVDVLDRTNKEATSYTCPTKKPNCRINRWQSLINKLKNSDSLTKVQQVNAFINHIEYLEDKKNIWKASDYWASPKQFLSYSGDCEDYAITKYITLKMLGFRDEQLRLVIVQDTKLSEIHAVLAVTIGNEIYILDNKTNLVIHDKSIKHYTPIYSINAYSWWKHA